MFLVDYAHPTILVICPSDSHPSGGFPVSGCGFKNKESGARSQESEERKEYWNAGMLGKEQGGIVSPN